MKQLLEPIIGIWNFLSNFLAFLLSLFDVCTTNFIVLVQMAIYRENNSDLIVFCIFEITLITKIHELAHLRQLSLARRLIIIYALRHRKVLTIRWEVPDAIRVVVRDIKLAATKKVLSFITNLRITVRLKSSFFTRNIWIFCIK